MPQHQQVPQPQPQAQAQAQRSKLPVILAIVGGVVAVVCAVCVAFVSVALRNAPDADVAVDTVDPRNTDESEPAESEAEQEPELPAGTITQRGLLLVGSDIQPGTYRGVGCAYWERVRDASGNFDAILANGNIGAGEVLTVTVLPTDFGLRSSCSRLYPLDAVPPDAIGTAGILAVGVDIQPGTWSGTATDHCYWARLGGFTGDFDDIITNDNVSAGERYVIDVQPGDRGLELGRGCGALSRV